jgi:hypothetical protein
MASTPQSFMRLSPSLIAEARDRAGMPPSARTVDVVRFALATLAGHPDPFKQLAVGPGRPRKVTAGG